MMVTLTDYEVGEAAKHLIAWAKREGRDMLCRGRSSALRDQFMTMHPEATVWDELAVLEALAPYFETRH